MNGNLGGAANSGYIKPAAPWMNEILKYGRWLWDPAVASEPARAAGTKALSLREEGSATPSLAHQHYIHQTSLLRPRVLSSPAAPVDNKLLRYHLCVCVHVLYELWVWSWLNT